LLSSADQVAKATGMAAAMTNKSVTGLRQNGRDRASARERMRIGGELRLFRALGERGMGGVWNPPRGVTSSVILGPGGGAAASTQRGRSVDGSPARPDRQ
jgi:hypothetical protein